MPETFATTLHVGYGLNSRGVCVWRESMELEVQSPGDEAHARLDERLMAFNIAQRPRVTWQKDVFTVIVKDGSGKECGGARGVVRMGAVDLQTPWLEEDLRGEGLGAKIVHAVEDEAQRRGARAVLLYTYDFQARGFYERLGYSCFGSFDFPDGVTRFYMGRRL
jgi:GNAT superfamily N-acetyltransferase